MNITATRQLVKFACTLQAQTIPEAIRHKVSLHLLDGLGCGWAASQHQSSKPTIHSARLFGGNGDCSVFGHTGFSPLAAAFSNAAVINGLDHDDGVEIDGKGLGHPGATLIAAAMAALDISPIPVSHEALITALTVGFEVNNRLIHAIQPSVERFNQVYGVAQHQSMGAALVTGLLLALDEQQLHNAVGLAAALTPLPSLHQYNWQQRPLLSIKDAVAPAAQAAVQAVIMAQQGMSGSLDVLDGEQGFWRMIGSDQFAPEILTHDLGNHWYANYGSFKIYPACRWLACALESLETLVQETGWRAEDIQSVEVHTFPRIVDDMMDYRPQNVTDAQFSLPWTMAAVAAGLTPGAGWYTEKNMKSPVLRALADKVTAILDPDFTARMTGPARQPGARVVLTHVNGSRSVQERFKPLGSSERPLTKSEVIAKARLNLAGLKIDSESLIKNMIQQDCTDQVFYSSAAQLTGASVLSTNCWI
ncbi:MmgE/PrpD family protein [Rahnella sp. LAC-M12]|uniref:MmgE/PrpD family protein n=2 Tax=Yersiniaceae TaxID=1903411 RepID=A0ABS0EAF3_9GAMM|nr:MmgE/PrpD family protein [Rahnella laticis]MBF8002142.1 MmgE/PrpD family protein [Rahnella sp. LAC-M12]